MKPPFFILAVFSTYLLGSYTLHATDPAPVPSSSASSSKGPERFLELFEPFRSTNATLSPDGKHLAYSVRENGKTSLVIVEVDNPGKIQTVASIGTDDDATPMFSENDEPTPLVISWMHWVTPSRLVLMTNQSTAVMRTISEDDPFHEGRNRSHLLDHESITSSRRPDGTSYDSFSGWTSMPGVILAVDADGKNFKTILSAVNLSRAIGPGPFGLDHRNNPGVQRVAPSIFDFSPNDPESLIIQARTEQRSQFCRLNVSTGKLKFLNEEIGEKDFAPLFDRQGKLRGGVRGTRFSSPPFRYSIQKDGLALGRWKNLDDAVDASVSKGFSVTPENYFGERSIPIGFDENPDLLYYASNIGRDTYGIYSLSLTTGKRTNFAVETTDFDLVPMPISGFASSVLVFDRFDRTLVGLRYDGALRTTRWLKPELATIQKDLESSFPGKNIEILEWDKSAERFLVLIHGVADPGSYMVYEPTKKKAYDIVRRAAWSDSHLQHRVMTFSFEANDGQKITGLLTFPAAGRFDLVPVVVRCPSQPAERVPLDFQAESMAIADMGFAVLQVNSRGAWGFGIKQRESLKNGYEKILIEDIITAVEKLSKRYRINPQRVALIGEGYGGFVALRGLQLAPDRFRCAATIDAPLDLDSWLEYDRWTRHSTTLELTRGYYGNETTLKEAPLVQHPDKVTKPVCLLTFPGLDGAPRTHTYLETRQFAATLRRQGTPVEFNELDKDISLASDNFETASDQKSEFVALDREFAQRLPRAEAAVYRKIEYFLNAYIYEYQVRLGPLKPLPQVEN